MNELVILVNSFHHQSIVTAALICLACLVQQPLADIREAFFSTKLSAPIVVSHVEQILEDDPLEDKFIAGEHVQLPSLTRAISVPVVVAGHIQTLFSLLSLDHRSLVLPLLQIMKYFYVVICFFNTELFAILELTARSLLSLV